MRLLSLFADHRRLAFLLAGLLLLLSSFAPVRAESDVFPVPDIIKHNVAFWIRIYTEVSLKEGLLHDSDYPQIVYEKCATGDRTGKARSEYIGGRMKIYSDAIVAVRDSAPDKWKATEKRIAEMFKALPAGALDSAEVRIRHQTGQRERFRLGVERSGMYLDTISAILKQHGVPDELKYLPHVESSFDATAYSRVGAAGLWQFMRATGRGYMRIDYMIDERSDPILSSHAAAKFLRANYDMLQTWPLAITGYNSGPNGMRRAVNNLGTRDIAIILEKHESASFKFASRNFYACFLAVLEIMENPDKYVKGVKPRPRWQATSIKLPFAIKPATLCKSLNITEQEFSRLNPSFRPVVFKEQKLMPAGYAVNLPHDMNGAEALVAINRSTPPPQRIAATKQAAAEAEAETAGGYYKVVSGDNLQAIARRLGVPMAKLAEVNNITNSSRIHVGQVLKIPSSARPTVATSAPTRHDAVETVAAASTKMDTVKIAAVSTKKDTVKTAAVSTKKDTVKIAAVSTKKDTVKTAVSTKKDTVKIAAVSTKADTVKTAAISTKTDTVKTVAVSTKKDTVKTTALITKADTVRTGTAAVTTRMDIIRAAAIKTAAVSTKTDTVTATPEPPATTGTTWPSFDHADTGADHADHPDITEVGIADTGPVDPALPDTLATAVLTEAEPAPAAPSVSDPSGKPSTDTRFDADAYDLGMRVAPGGAYVRVRVTVDETIGQFASWMRVSSAQIRELNNMEPNSVLVPGNMLNIPISASTNINRFEVNRMQYHLAIEEDFFARYDVVDFDQRTLKPGDNLWRICRDAQIPMWLLKKYNRGRHFYYPQPGNQFWIPRIAPKAGTVEGGNEFDQIVTESEESE